jgi:hypothetical protein
MMHFGPESGKRHGSGLPFGANIALELPGVTSYHGHGNYNGQET